ncbi:divergent polysaccharide deacetylase family protein [Cognatiyoonia sp. IB215182]|uniref:divergent polysaccharide deacetylase family protein n=1 Tax=Cognatiyoonia sp. IB215182 TaxID=3097353 RepID=UPI002A143411|nr:divergent polysaccharide deacetylase family protein [Cognatiyoonia sp. IB215182]MDX8353407.1 divergent polysaccharide deacetylase family protein [Cognatiyoonia sp. IB215182]
MSGYVSGSLWGLILGGVGLGFASQVANLPAGNAPPETPQVAAPQTVAETSIAVVEAPEPAPEEPVVAVETPQVEQPEVDVAAPLTETTPPAPPAAPAVTTELVVPTPSEDPDITREPEPPQLPRDVVTAPVAPAPEANVVIATQPPAPEVETETAEEEPSVVAVEPEEPVVPTETVAEAVPAEPEDQPVPSSDVATAPIQPEEPPAPSTDVADAPTATESIVPVPETTVPETVVAEPVVPEEDSAPAVPQPAEVPPVAIVAIPPVEEAPQPAPEIIAVQDTTETPLPQVNTGVRVNRPGAEPSETAGQEAEVVVDDSGLDDLPALERYATVFEATPDVPLMSILLIDEGQGDGAAQIAALPFPATVVVDALADDATARMQAYRDAGVEVVMQTSLPAGAVPTDVEVAFEAAFDILPETVALFSGANGLLQSNRAVTTQVIEVLQSEGRGLIVVERGLSNAIRGAEQVGLPAAPVLRALDAEGAPAIGRALDQAAFRARQAGNGIILAELTDDTIAALASWGAENDGAQIALAPVSAILQGSVAAE